MRKKESEMHLTYYSLHTSYNLLAVVDDDDNGGLFASSFLIAVQ